MTISRRCVLGLALVPVLIPHSLRAQGMMSGLDMNSPKMTRADMTRADIEKLLSAGNTLDLANKSLNGLDLSDLDLSGANFRAAYLNKTKFSATRLVGAIFDQVWALHADFSGADLTRASLFAAQMQDSNFDKADFSYARVAGDFSNSLMRGAKFIRADLSADMKNQSMGLMRAVLRSADLSGADFQDANMANSDLHFAKLAGAHFINADLTGAEANGANFQGALFGNTILTDVDVTGAEIDAVQMPVFAKATNLDRVIKK